MSEYIVDIPSDYNRDGIYHPDERHGGIPIIGEIVRCCDCKYYYEAEEYHPLGNYDRRCCTYFVTYNDEVDPDGFCAWGQIPTK